MSKLVTPRGRRPYWNKSAWSDRQRRVFLEHIAAGCSVADAAAAVGRTEKAAASHRYANADFDQQWRDASKLAYDRIEAQAMAKIHADRGQTVVEGEEGPVPPPVEDMDFDRAMEFLKFQQYARKAEAKGNRPRPRMATKEELALAIAERLQMLKQRQARRERGGGA